MRPASRSPYSDGFSTLRHVVEPQRRNKPTTESLSGIEIQSSYDRVSIVQSLTASKVCCCSRCNRSACASRLEVPRIRLAGSFHQID